MKFIKYAIGATVGLVVVVIALVFAVVTFVDPNAFKGRIEDQVAAETGRTLSIDGDIEWGFWPKIRLKTGAIALSNAPGFGDAPFLKLDEFEFAVATWPLVTSDIKMDAVKLYGFEVNLAKNAEGVTNWADLAGEGQRDAEDDHGGGGGDLGDLPAIALGGVDIRDAKITYRDASTGQDLTLSKINVTTGPLELGDPVDLTMTMDLASKKPDIDGDANFSATIVYDLGAEHYVVEPMTFVSNLAGPRIPGGKTTLNLGGTIDADMGEGVVEVKGLSFSGLDTEMKTELTAFDLKRDKPGARGSVDIDGKDIALVFRILESPIADQLAAAPDRSFAFDLDFDANMREGNVAVPTLEASLLGTNVDGQLVASHADTEKPKVTGSLTAAGPDLPALVALAGQLAGDDALREMGSKLGSTRDKTFSFETAFDADLKSGKVAVSSLKGKGLGLTLDGGLTAANVNSDSGKIDGRVSLEGRNLKPLLAAAGQEGLGDVVQALSANAGFSGTTANLALAPLSVTTTVAGPTIPNGPVDLKLTAGSAGANLDDETASVKDLKITGLGLNLTGNLDASKITSAPEATGSLEIEPFDLRAFMTSLEQELPPMADPKTLTRFGLDTTFSGSTRKASIDRLAVVLDETRLTGTVSIDDLEKQSLRFDLEIDQIDADRYLPPPTKEAKGGDAKGTANKPAPVTPETAAAGAATELPVEMLRALDVDGDIDIGQLKISGATMQAIKVSVRAKDGDLRVDPVSAKLYEGGYDGKIGLDATTDTPAVTIDSTLSGVKIRPLLEDVAGNGMIGGTADIALDFRGAGATPEAIQKSLNGEAKLSVSEGTIRGLTGLSKLGQRVGGVSSLMSGDVAGAARSADGGSGDAPKELYFTGLSATAVAKDGVVTNDDLTLEAPLIRATGNGTLVDFHKNAIDYTTEVTIVATLQGEGGKSLEDITGLPVPMLRQLKGIPISVRRHGPLDAQKTEVDWAKLTASMPDGNLKDAFKTGDTLNRLKENPGDVVKEKLFDKLLGGKKTEEAAPAPSDAGGDAPAAAPEAPKSAEDEVKDKAEKMLKGLFN